MERGALSRLGKTELEAYLERRRENIIFSRKKDLGWGRKFGFGWSGERLLRKRRTDEHFYVHILSNEGDTNLGPTQKKLIS
mmetsp:Transcript_1184/g.1875  ORF Transcript_1184/g.1875 Transcript_1184/m.1875 type:complete len:81 (+) Transcript_1184:367-609(+)